MRAPHPLAAGLLAFALLAGCQSDPTASVDAEYAPELEESADMARSAPTQADGAAPDAGTSGPSVIPAQTGPDSVATSAQDLVLLKTATVSVEVGDYPEAAAAVRATVGRFDAYLGGENETRSAYRVSNTFTIRVAAGEFDALLEALSGIGQVESRQVDVTDVTEEFVDVQARLRARRAVEAQYVALLGRSGTIEDILQVQQRLAQVREEIERAEGRLRFLRNRAALSTITLTVYEESATGIATGPGFFAKIADAFEAGWEAVLAALVAAVALWPFWILLAAFVWWLRRRSRRSPRATPPTAPAPGTPPGSEG